MTKELIDMQEARLRVLEMRTEHIEKLAAAYMKLTNIPPDQCEAVLSFRMTDEGFEYTCFYRMRE